MQGDVHDHAHDGVSVSPSHAALLQLVEEEIRGRVRTQRMRDPSRSPPRWPGETREETQSHHAPHAHDHAVDHAEVRHVSSKSPVPLRLSPPPSRHVSSIASPPRLPLDQRGRLGQGAHMDTGETRMRDTDHASHHPHDHAVDHAGEVRHVDDLLTIGSAALPGGSPLDAAKAYRSTSSVSFALHEDSHAPDHAPNHVVDHAVHNVSPPSPRSIYEALLSLSPSRRVSIQPHFDPWITK